MSTVSGSRPSVDSCVFPDTYSDECPEADYGHDFEPSEMDEDYAMTRSGGCRPDELSPSEIAERAGTMTAMEYWSQVLDPTGDEEEYEALARYEMGLLF